MGDFFTFGQVDRFLGRSAGSPIPQGIRTDAQVSAPIGKILKNDLYARENDLFMPPDRRRGGPEVKIDIGSASPRERSPTGARAQENPAGRTGRVDTGGGRRTAVNRGTARRRP
ncbi:hypothetical protein [Actinomadura nitritigenes]|uniref:hypothetical protein n=1 Tax=Actinomadura nitritigenes TaxID=134602 RepID=UPI003D8D440D